MNHIKTKLPIERLLQLVKRLYEFEKLNSKQLAEDYNLSERTIRRDFDKISSIIPLSKSKGEWLLDKQHHNSMSPLYHEMLSSFAHNAKIDVTCLDKGNITEDKIAFATQYKNLPKDLGEKILKAISTNKRAKFTYRKQNEITQREIDPIKLYEEKGRWYIVARDYKDDGIKKFILSIVEGFNILEHSKQSLTPEMIQEASQINSVWQSSRTKSEIVKLYIEPQVVHYIKDIKLHQTQKIEEEHYDTGGIVVSYVITHEMEILPAVQSWLPHVHIIEPKWIRDKLKQNLSEYLEEDKDFDI
jgi:predicted DNA-binding transcriptional regulator YafY